MSSLSKEEMELYTRCYFKMLELIADHNIDYDEHHDLLLNSLLKHTKAFCGDKCAFAFVNGRVHNLIHKIQEKQCKVIPVGILTKNTYVISNSYSDEVVKTFEVLQKRISAVNYKWFLLYYIHGYSTIEIGKMYNLTHSRISQSLIRSRIIFKTLLSKYAPETFKECIKTKN